MRIIITIRLSKITNYFSSKQRLCKIEFCTVELWAHKFIIMGWCVNKNDINRCFFIGERRLEVSATSSKTHFL
jgi:hypothetical protein